MTCRAFFLAAAMLVAAAPFAAPACAAPAKIKAGISGQDWGTTQKGEKVRLFTLTGKGGMVARITNFGGVVVDLIVPDRHGKPTNVVLGYDDFASYEKGGVYSALIGRYANRLSFKFLVDGKIYEQPAPPPRPAPAGSAPGSTRCRHTARRLTSDRSSEPRRCACTRKGRRSANRAQLSSTPCVPSCAERWRTARSALGRR